MGHSLDYDVNCSMLFTEHPLRQRPAAARTAGFDAVEFWWPFGVAAPADARVDAFVRAVSDAGMRLVGLNFFAGDMSAGDRGVLSWPGRSAEFRDSVAVAVGIAERLGCRAFNALYGNRRGGADPAEQDELAAENLVFAADEVARIGASVLLEPVSGAPSYPLRTAADAVAVIDRVAAAGRHNLTLLADLYHLAVNGDDLDAVITEHTHRIGHVQIADVPGRHEPGTGQLDIEGYLSELAANGYSGSVGLEYEPSRASAESVNWLPRHRRAGQHRANLAGEK